MPPAIFQFCLFFYGGGFDLHKTLHTDFKIATAKHLKKQRWSEAAYHLLALYWESARWHLMESLTALVETAVMSKEEQLK